MASQYTPNYNLDLYVGTDKPNLRDQYNAAMGKVDTAIKGNANSISANGTAIGNLTTRVSNDEQEITSLRSDVDQVEQNLEGKAPTMHAVNANTYGQGTAANWGHVKLSDATDSTSNTTGGTASTPAAVKSAMDTASNAATAAGNASTLAQTAKTTADTASATASAAQTAANNAQTTANTAITRITTVEELVARNPIQVDLSTGNFDTKLVYDIVADYCTVRTYAKTAQNLTPGQIVTVGTIPVAQRPTVTIQQLVNVGLSAGNQFSVWMVIKPDGTVTISNSGTATVGVDASVAYIIGYYDPNGVNANVAALMAMSEEVE